MRLNKSIALPMALAAFAVCSSVHAGNAPALVQCQNTRLNGPLAPDQEIGGYRVTRDGTRRVLFLSDVVLDEEFDPLTVPQDGSAPPTLFDINRIPGRFLDGFPEIASATERAVLIGDFDTLDVDELFSVSTATGGGPLTKLSGPIVAGGEVRSFAISGDGSTVVYLARQEDPQRDELYQVPINGGAASKLNAPLTGSRDVERDYAISSDNRYAVFRANRLVFEDDLFSTELATGNRVQLNPPGTSPGDVFNFQLSPDGATVVYQANQDDSNIFELFRVPIGGGTAQKVSGPEVERDVDEYVITADSSRVIYQVSQTSGQTFTDAIYSAPLDGGSPLRLTSDSGTPESIRRFVLTPDNSTVLFESLVDGQRQLFTVSVTGGPVNRISADPAIVGSSNGFALAPDGEQVAYAAVTGFVASAQRRLRAVGIDGSADRQLTGPSVVGGNIEEFQITPDSRQVVFSGDFLTVDQLELFAVSLDAPGPVRRINGPLPAGAAVGARSNNDFEQTLDGQRVVYLADQNVVGRKELYSADIRCDDLFRNGFEAAP